MNVLKLNCHAVKLAAFAASVFIVSLQPTAQAQTNGTWAPLNGNGGWNTPSNWTSNITAAGAGSTANFTQNITGLVGVNVDINPVVGIINIGDSNGTHAYVIQSTGNLTLNNNGSPAQINFLSSGITNTISQAPIRLIDSLQISNASNSTQTISSAVSSANGTTTITNLGGGNGSVSLSGVITNGNGTVSVIQNSATSALTLGNTGNTFSGGVTVQAGTVFTVGGSAALGTGTLTLGASSGSSNAALFGNFNSVNHTNAISVASGNTGTASLGSLQGTTFSGAVTLNSHDLSLLTPVNGQGLTLSGGVSGTGNLTLSTSSTGIITLSTGAINNTGTITNSGNGSSTSVISAAIGTNVTGLVQDSATSNLTLSGNSTFTSGITIKSGTLTGTTSNNAFGANSNTITIGASNGSANATLAILNGGSYANPISVASGNNGTARISTSSTLVTLSGAITLNSHDLLATALHTLNLTGGVSGTGNLDLQNNSGFSSTISTAGINNVGTVKFGGTGATISGWLVSAPIGSNVTQVIQNGAYSTTLSGNNTFGGLTIEAGTVIAGSANAVGSGTILLGNTSGSANATLNLATTTTYANALTVQAGNSGTASLNYSQTAAATYSGLITVNKDLNINSTNGGGSPSFTLSGTTTGAALTGAGNVTFSAVSGVNFLELGGNNTGFTGNILINGRPFRLGSATALSANNTVAVDSLNGATFNIQAFSATIAGLNNGANGGGNVTNSGAAATLTLGGSGTYAFSGNISATTPANLSITKSGVGTQTLSGTNTYAGVTTVNVGVFSAASNSALGSTANGTIVASGAALQVSNNINIGTEALTLNGTGVGSGGALRSISGNNTVAGAITLGTSGATIASDANTLTVSGNITGATRNLAISGNGSTVLSGIVGTTTGTLTKAGLGTLQLTGNNTYSGGTTVSAGLLLVNNLTGSGTGSGTVDVTTAGALGGNGTISGVTTISGSLRPGNSIGTLAISNNVTWNGGVDWVFELGTGASTLALANTTPGLSDLLNITGNFVQGTGSSFTFDFSGQGTEGWYKVVDWTGSTTFSAGNFTASNLGSGLTGNFTVDAGTSALYLNVVPEPSIWLLLAGSLTFLMIFRRRSQKF